MQLSTLIVFVSYSMISICGYHPRMSNDQNVFIRRLIQLKDNFGCDVIIPSCGPKGKCCDHHDACFKRYGCRQNSWAWSWLPGAVFFDPCARCNTAVFFCTTSIFTWPGPSQCCANGNCGQTRLRHRSYKITR